MIFSIFLNLTFVRLNDDVVETVELELELDDFGGVSGLLDRSKGAGADFRLVRAVLLGFELAAHNFLASGKFSF